MALTFSGRISFKVDILTQKERKELLNIARLSLECGIEEHRSYSPDLKEVSPNLTKPGASFCTLKRDGQLRGCIGTLEPYQALVIDVAENAFASGFRDSRFESLVFAELESVSIELSVLGELAPIQNMGDTELQAYLLHSKPGIVLQKGDHRATFLPSVWSSLPEPSRFLEELKKKAGLSAKEDSLSIDYYEYSVEKFAEEL